MPQPAATSECFSSLDVFKSHYSDVIISAMASQITSPTIVYSIVYSGADQRKHQSPASMAFVRGIHQWSVNSPHNISIWWRHHASPMRHWKQSLHSHRYICYQATHQSILPSHYFIDHSFTRGICLSYVFFRQRNLLTVCFSSARGIPVPEWRLLTWFVGVAGVALFCDGDHCPCSVLCKDPGV